MNEELKTLAPKALVLSKIATIRRDNLRTLCNIHGTSALSRRLGYRSPSFLSQMVGPKPAREVTEKSAREFEQRLEMPEGTLDREGWDPTMPEHPVAPQSLMPLPVATPVAADPVTANASVVSDVIRVISAVSASEQVNVSPSKFPDVVAMSFADSMEHGGVPRESFIKQLIHLLK